MVAAAMVGAAAIGAAGSAYSSKQSGKAAKAQANSADQASQVQWDMYNQTRQDLSPYSDAGKSALQQLMSKMGEGGYFNQTYTGQDVYNDPSYQFRLNQGLGGVQQGAAAQGGLLSGATQKALNNYAQNFASQEYSNAYNRFNADQTNQYNRLANLAGMGQNAAAQTGNAGLQTGQAVANNTMAGANAQAAGAVANANNWNNYASQLGSMATAYAMNKNSGAI
ncbi:DNA transfer protein p32 [Acinetobacter sp. WCHAc010034]|uniref:DNA transfer protein p32 n=1 Tax=Acinetobacter sp. WCHAc010034 TaxID=1879049 RepID=UPI00083A12EA|nr:DNA transfer protein p32 [Acinetobacter sp. WCHAc010034]AYA04628.1 DNA transfer protein p32 [Acinetobacter sp. WCHAc010034]